MRKWLSTPTTLSFVCAMLLAISPMVARAETQTPPALAPVIITEIQPGTTASASEEFIELYNTTDQTIDFSSHVWRLEITSSAATTWESPFRTVTLSGRLESGQSYLVASQFTSNGQATKYLNGQANAWFGAGISATAGHVRLVYETNRTQGDGTCATVLNLVDRIEWSTSQAGQPSVPSIDGRPVFLTASDGLAKTTSLQRPLDPAGQTYVDTDNDLIDLGAEAPSPGEVNTLLYSGEAPTSSPMVVAAPVNDCGSELPSADDESETPPNEPPAAEPPAPEPPAPTEEPDAPNDSDETAGTDDANPPPTEPTNHGLLTPVISELLPDPAPPQADNNDEFVELYNPNSVIFDLTGYTLRAGLTTVHAFTFPAGTKLTPQSFMTFSSADTHLSLANNAGQVVLLNAAGLEVAHSSAYAEAKPGQAWVLHNGTWQWTTTPTPNTINVLTKPATQAASPKKKAATPTKTKTSNPAKSTEAKKAPKKTQTTASTTSQRKSINPIRPWVLAVAAAGALLYGAYEYRRDLANRIHRFRTNRAARRQARQSAKGRRSH